VFIIGTGAEVVEDERRKPGDGPQVLASLPVTVSGRLLKELMGQIKAGPLVVAVEKEKAVFRIAHAVGLRGLHTITIRATALQDGKYPAISETHVPVEFLPAGPIPRQSR
jgi:hypothetical protein